MSSSDSPFVPTILKEHTPPVPDELSQNSALRPSRSCLLEELPPVEALGVFAAVDLLQERGQEPLLRQSQCQSQRLQRS
eukprot:CAMPEP_0171126086 /NCGR_PEP_ID=MMETSP0766_2-20121228/112596_1 /TAXON_ID=439317 /ORGANISM="Gambierdiscus australes, Strain CAWD 149" /LENGTH=78 /DNA_ID=CAMNT_0011589099 /DNA_START=152 /DNA_END=385 /DNA_ORIENTATION=-